MLDPIFFTAVVSYSISTSNHNYLSLNPSSDALYLIPFLHQTTTMLLFGFCEKMLYLIPFLHQTTTTNCSSTLILSCILFHFYIKPQHIPDTYVDDLSCILFHFYIKPQPFFYIYRYILVVSYSISTSNHNLWRIRHYFQAHYHLNHILIFNGML